MDRPIDDLPPGATLEPWTDGDDAEALAASASVIWPWLLAQANAHRRHLIVAAQLTDDELATAAARFGIVADPDALPGNTIRHAYVRHPDDGRTAYQSEAIARQRETGDVWAIARRHYRNRDLARAPYMHAEWALDILRGDALPFPESRQRGDHDFAESHPNRYASWPIVQAAR